MSGMKDKQSGDYAPSRAPYMDIGKFRISVSHHFLDDKVWIRDMETGEGGAFDVAELEEKIREFFGENF